MAGKKSDTDRRELLLVSAVELFQQRPYEDVAPKDIALRAGVAHGLLFYYFKDKRGIFIEAFKRVSREFDDYRRPRGNERTFDERINGFLRRHFAYMKKNPQTFLGFMRGGPGADVEVRKVVDAARAEALDMALDSFGVPVARSPLVRATLRGWVGFVDEVTLDWLTYKDLKVDELVRVTHEALTAALNSVDVHPSV